MSFRVMTVDDSPILRKAIKKVVMLVGVEEGGISEAANGQEALDRLESDWVDLVLLDLNMPVMDGLQFLRELRNRPEHRSLPVVVVSTDANEERRTLLRTLGVNHFLHKPFEPEALRAILEKLRGPTK
jgi:two-component system, chemotaxis family, chemotaxis protein CheY